MMGRLGVADDEPIENGLITRSLESAQKKIEGFNFDARKHVLEYDDVLNLQRKTVYERRRKILMGNREDVESELQTLIAGDEKLVALVDEKKKGFADDEFYKVVRRMFLQTIDMFWVEHLEVMEYTRGSVNLRAYGQRDPLVEYKKEGLRLFKEMQEAINAQIISLLGSLQTGAFSKEEAELREIQKQAKEIGGSDSAGVGMAFSAAKPVIKNAEGNKIGRNDPCYCGSGKKYKNCHGKGK